MIGFKYPTAYEIVAEYLRQLDSGSTVTEEDVIAKHRQLEEELRSEFRKLSVITNAVSKNDASGGTAQTPEESSDTLPRHTQPSRPTVLRCPHCKKPTEATLEGSFRAVTCESCGNEFSLIRERKWPKQIAHFELLEQLGVGGFGSVWKARDRELNRLVALKLPRRAFLEEAEQEQFIREAQTAAQLNHPNIVKVHEVGVYDGSIYIVTELVEGKPLSQHIQNGLPENEALQLVEPIARALHYAHECGVIHRDLKPQNVILGRDHKPYLSDFGLARRGDTDLTLTVSGQILGTPRYMSPEQARGDSHSADARSDIFSLGILLYELLTGQVPFEGNPDTILYRVQTEDAPNPRKLNSSISRDLATICLKCLEKKPEQRYQTAQVVAEELCRVAAGTPIVARPVGAAERSYRWAKRNPVVASLAAGLLVTFVVSSLVGSFLYAQAKIQENRLQAQEQLNQNIRWQKLLTDIRHIRALGHGGYRDEIFEKVRSNPEFVRDPEFTRDVRTEVLLSMGDPAAYDARFLNFDGDDLAASAAVCFDGSRVAVAFESGRIELHRTDNLELIEYMGNLNHASVALRFLGRSSTELLSLGRRGTLSRVSFLDEQPAHALANLLEPLRGDNDPPSDRLLAARFSADGQFVAFTDGRAVVLWDVEQDREVFSKVPSLDTSSVIRCVAVSADGDQIAAGHSDELGTLGGVIRWRLTGTRDGAEKPLHRGRQYDQSLAMSDDGEWLAVGCEQTIVLNSASMEKDLFFHDTEVFALAFNSDASYLAIDYISGMVEIKNRKTNTAVAQLKQSPTQKNEGVAFSQNNSRFLAWNRGGIRVLGLNSRTERIQIDVHERAVPTLRFTPDGRRLVSCSKDGTILSWDPRTGERRPASVPNLGQVQCFAIHPTEPWIAVAQWADVEPLTIWKFTDQGHEKLAILDSDLGHISGLDFSPDGMHLAASGEQGLRVWKVEMSGDDLLPALVCQENDADRKEEDRCLVFDNSGRIFHADTWGDHVKYFDIQQKRGGHLGNPDDPDEIDQLEGWHGLAVAHDNLLALVNPEGQLELWGIDDMSDGGSRKSVLGRPLTFSAPNVAASPTGLVAGLVGPKSITIWDVARGEELYRLRDERNTIYSLAWSPDGTMLAVGLSDGGISIWDVAKIQQGLTDLGFVR